MILIVGSTYILKSMHELAILIFFFFFLLEKGSKVEKKTKKAGEKKKKGKGEKLDEVVVV